MTAIARPSVDLGASLDDKYDLGKSRVLLTGTQALVRLMMMQRARDIASGLNTAGYVTGYRGSPLGGVDLQFQRAGAVLDEHHIKFSPGLNEDLAATALWGTQQAELYGEGRYDGVFGMWYGKGPGVDRSGDVLRHANHAGTSPHGGVLVLMGDDHTAESSTIAHQSEFALIDAMIPILNPAGVQELIDFGLMGYALSRFSGCWVGLKAIKDTIEVTATVDADPGRLPIRLPDDFEMPEGGLNIRAVDGIMEQEARLHDHKRFATTAFARANRLDRTVFAGGSKPQLGIITVGKSYLDVREALDELGIEEALAADLGLRLHKVAMPWPLEPEGIERFAEGLDRILVVEEKRSLIETQLREQLYGRANAPVIVGKKNETGATLLQAKAALEPNQIAVAIAERLLDRAPHEGVAKRLEGIRAITERAAESPGRIERLPYYCAGCPHNTSTVVPKGARAFAGIGCHYMAKFMDRDTIGTTQMGGEGANWIGEAPFSKRPHMFVNLGDGTYNHSGILPIRASVYAGVNVTFKVLFNDAVAMTGGQANDGGLSVAAIARQVAAEGVGRIVIVSDEPEKYPADAGFPASTQVHHRDDLMEVQRELQESPGVSVLIYDQTCAAEKRRRRKRGLYPDPPKRAVINELVCEGCGDCGVKSNCVAIVPVETEFGRKRAVHQSSCNKDFSCLKGFCPSFVTVHGGELRRGRAGEAAGADAEFAPLPEPAVALGDRPTSIVVAGIGGTGVVTIGALIAMAAHLEGKGANVLDMAGLAQKGGAVTSHVRVAANPADISAVRVEAGGGDLVLGCDMVTAGGAKVFATMAEGTAAVVNTQVTMTADFTHRPDLKMPTELLRRAIARRVGEENAHFIDAGGLATALMGDAIAANLFLLGFASQKGLLPVSAAGLDRAIELNGVAVSMNRQAFLWGRRAAVDLAAVEKIAAPAMPARESAKQPEGLEALVRRRAEFLTGYQDRAYADRYAAFVERVRATEANAAPGCTALAETVARAYFKLLSYKDEYEVARLYTDGSFARQLAREFTGDYKLKFHLAPPILAKPDPITGEPPKRVFGAWMMGVYRLLARLKGLRGTVFDPFGRSEERRLERRIIDEYETVIGEILGGLSTDNHATAVEIAGLPLAMRGFGHVKAAAVAAVKEKEVELLAAFRRAPGPTRAVA